VVAGKKHAMAAPGNFGTDCELMLWWSLGQSHSCRSCFMTWDLFTRHMVSAVLARAHACSPQPALC
jgi:predicted Rossmann-fold nucleotide-binding protein